VFFAAELNKRAVMGAGERKGTSKPIVEAKKSNGTVEMVSAE
jgi:hypothetical protein